MASRFDPDDQADDRVGMEHVLVDDVDDLELEADDDVDEDDDEDEEDEFDEDYDDELDDDLEDATDDDIDFVIALYREDGLATAVPLEADLANDLDELIAQLQRLPGDAGAIGLASINQEVLVAVRVRGPRHVQIMTSDISCADTWPIVRDVADFFAIEPGEDDTPEEGPVGDLGLFADQGLREEGLEALCIEEDEIGSDELAERIVRAIHFDADTFAKVIDDYWDGEDD